MPIELNDLESARFNITAASLTDVNADLAVVNARARELGVDMITTRVTFNALERVHMLESDGYRLMDTLVYYIGKIAEAPSQKPLQEGIRLRGSSPQDAAAVAKIAASAFAGYLGHYHADPRLENSAADAAYVEWAENSIRHSDGLPAILVEVDAAVAGFMTLRRNTPQEIEIVLNAVHPDMAGQGLYRAMLEDALHSAQKLGSTQLVVSTQINNTKVQRAWVRQGLIPSHGYYTFHKWFEKA